MRTRFQQGLDDLREMNCGRWEGMSFLEVREEDAELYRQWISDPEACCPGGESHAGLRRRMEKAIASIDNGEGANSRPVVVSHATAIRVITTSLLELSIESARAFAQDNAAINIFTRRGGRFVLKLWNTYSFYVLFSQRDLTLSHLLQYSLFTLAVVIALAAILGWIFSGRALRPVHLITTAAQALTSYNRLSQQAIARVRAGGDRLVDPVEIDSRRFAGFAMPTNTVSWTLSRTSRLVRPRQAIAGADGAAVIGLGVLSPEEEVDERPEQLDEDDHQSPDQLVAALHPALGASQIVEARRDQRHVQDCQRDEERKGLLESHSDENTARPRTNVPLDVPGRSV